MHSHAGAWERELTAAGCSLNTYTVSGAWERELFGEEMTCSLEYFHSLSCVERNILRHSNKAIEEACNMLSKISSSKQQRQLAADQRTTLVIRQPDDFHVHLRDTDFLKLTVNHSAQRFGRIGVMPNLVPPVTTATQALAYRQRILAALEDNHSLEPLMILFLNENTALADIKTAAESPSFLGVKYYPAGVTTNALSKLTNLKDAYQILESMEEHQLPLLLHGESPAPDVDVFDREQRFLEAQVEPLIKRFPKLRIVLEHITTADAVEFIRAHKGYLGATITAHHLMYNRNDMLGNGIKPHLYCKPILKRRHHQEALRQAATSAEEFFFLGTDSAPHTLADKESACGCAGCYTAHAAIELYAEVFEEENALDRLEKFSSLNGANFYGLTPNESTITLVRDNWQPPNIFYAGEQQIVPLRAQTPVRWMLDKI